MAEPRTLEEVEVPDPSVVTFPQQQVPLGTPPTMPRPVQPINLATLYHGIASVLATKLQCLLLVVAMIVLSGEAVFDPEIPRLWAAGGFNLFGLAGLVILGRRQ